MYIELNICQNNIIIICRYLYNDNHHFLEKPQTANNPFESINCMYEITYFVTGAEHVPFHIIPDPSSSHKVCITQSLLENQFRWVIHDSGNPKTCLTTRNNNSGTHDSLQICTFMNILDSNTTHSPPMNRYSLAAVLYLIVLHLLIIQFPVQNINM